MINKTVLITGAAQRLGAEIARHLHAKGMDIVIHYHQSGTKAETLTRELNTVRADSTLCLQGNLHDDPVFTEIIEQSYQFKNRLDVLINNASSFYPVPVDEVTSEQWDDLVGTNMRAPFFLIQHATKYLKETRGCIVNITDIHAQRPLKNHAVYSAAKAGLVMLTRALAKELGPDIRVNAVAPGAILWPENMDSIDKEKILSRTALKRQGKPEDIAKAVYFLIQDADYMTGQILTVDGGRSLFS